MSILGSILDSPPSFRFHESGSPAEERPPCDLIGDSAATERLRLQIDRIGPHFRTVLVQGEMGTGKELVARALHARGRNAASFVACHGAALADAVDEDGPFLPSPWQLLRAGGPATVFIDGIDEVPIEAQPRLLEVMGERANERPNLKIIAATGQNLKRMIAAGQFRSDLYHRLATIEIVIEPLRRRRDDIPALAHHLVGRFAALYDREPLAIADDALARLQAHDWPGNVREMENVLRNGVLECDGDVLEARHLGAMVELVDSFPGTEPASRLETPAKLQDVVEQHVLSVLRTCSGNKVRAAEMLGISRSTLYRMLDGCSAPERMQL